MPRTLIADLAACIGKPVSLEGWAHTIRDHGKICFLVLRDVSGLAQCVVLKSDGDVFATAGSLVTESVLRIHGTAKKEAQAPGGIEVAVSRIEVLSVPAVELPIPIIEKSGETDQALRLDYRWLDLRKPEKLLIFKVATLLEQCFRDYWISHGFIEIHSPKLMNSPSESGADLFEVKYFDRMAYLAQSPQFYKQMAMAAGFERVFEVGPVFRAEPSFTTRHATEFTGYDFEMSFIESHQDLIAVWQEMIAEALGKIAQAYGAEIERIYGRKLAIPTLPFPQLTMREAKDLLAADGLASEREGDLSPEEEKRLCALMRERTGHEFVFVTEYPVSVRPFIHMRKEDEPELTKSFDLLWNGVEITTGAQREHRYEVLARQAEEKGLPPGLPDPYLSFFKYGCPPHGGAGIGPARMLMKIFDTENIREVTFLHRGVNRLTP